MKNKKKKHQWKKLDLCLHFLGHKSSLMPDGLTVEHLKSWMRENPTDFHPSFLKDIFGEKDAFESYRNMCEWNGHEPAGSEMGDYDKKEA